MYFICKSHDAFSVILKLHDEWLDVFALCLPFSNCAFSVGVEILLLLVQKGLGLQTCMVMVLEVLLLLFFLNV